MTMPTAAAPVRSAWRRVIASDTADYRTLTINLMGCTVRLWKIGIQTLA
jgi:hypothetical protein